MYFNVIKNGRLVIKIGRLVIKIGMLVIKNGKLVRILRRKNHESTDIYWVFFVYKIK